jgi:hypothetical protein
MSTHSRADREKVMRGIAERIQSIAQEIRQGFSAGS